MTRDGFGQGDRLTSSSWNIEFEKTKEHEDDEREYDISMTWLILNKKTNMLVREDIKLDGSKYGPRKMYILIKKVV